MARPGILYSDVARAAAKLVTAGTNPTVDGVREALGGTGSKSTIAPLLKRWKTERQETVAATEVGLPESLLQAVKALHEHMQSEFAERLEQARQEHDDALRIAFEREETLHAAHQVLAAAHAAQTEELKRAQAALAQLQETHHAQGMRLAAIEAENAGLQQRLADRVQEVAMLDRQLSQAREQSEHFQEAAAAQRTEENRAYEQRIARLEQELAGAQRHIAAQQTTIGQREERIAHLMAERERQEQALQQARVAMMTEQSTRERMVGRMEEMTAVRTMLDGELEILRRQLVETAGMLAAKEREAAMLAEQAQRAEARADRLTAENANLLQVRNALEQQVRKFDAQRGVP